jgi:DoxX-like family
MTQRTIAPSKAALVTGRVFKYLLVLFLLFDASMKLIREPHVLRDSASLGIPGGNLQVLGLYLLFSAIFFAIPRTALLGAVLITAYLGGAAAVTLISKLDGHPYLFPMIFCVLLWAAEYLQSLRLRGVLPIIKHQ